MKLPHEALKDIEQPTTPKKITPTEALDFALNLLSEVDHGSARQRQSVARGVADLFARLVEYADNGQLPVLTARIKVPFHQRKGSPS